MDNEITSDMLAEQTFPFFAVLLNNTMQIFFFTLDLNFVSIATFGPERNQSRLTKLTL